MSEVQTCNPLPEGFEGKQKRRTDFESPEDKLSYDAAGLIDLARRTYQRNVVTVEEAMGLRSRTNAESGADDDVEALRANIAVNLKTEPGYEAFVNGLDLPEADREKLKAMLTLKEYRLSVETYYEMGGTKAPPTREQIMKEIMTWSLERLRLECSMREKPTIVMVPDKSFDENITTMDAHQCYSNTEGDQDDAYVNGDSKSPYKNAPRPTHNLVTIEDGVPHPKKLDGVSSRLGERRDYLTLKFRQAGMEHISGPAMQTLLQRSLKQARATNDNSRIVDNWEDGTGTATFINPELLTESPLVACSYFSSRARRANFYALNPEDEAGYLQGRASAQVMQF